MIYLSDYILFFKVYQILVFKVNIYIVFCYCYFMVTKKSLEIELSKLEPLVKYDVSLEQYSIDSYFASEILWWAYMNGDIKDFSVCDLGCGNGILGSGCSILGASSVYFVDVDPKAISVAKNNCSGKFFCCDVSSFDLKVDVVVMNPPFGVQNCHADRKFLLKAFSIANVIYSIHKIESKNFVTKLALENGFALVDVFSFDFVLGKLYKFHTKEKYKVSVGCFLLRKV